MQIINDGYYRYGKHSKNSHRQHRFLRYTMTLANMWTNDNGDQYSQLDLTLRNEGDADLCGALILIKYDSNETRIENSWNLEELDDKHNNNHHRHRFRLPDGIRLASNGQTYTAGLTIVGRMPVLRIDETKKCS